MKSWYLWDPLFDSHDIKQPINFVTTLMAKLKQDSIAD